jgi:uncharacterized protein YggE
MFRRPSTAFAILMFISIWFLGVVGVLGADFEGVSEIQVTATSEVRLPADRAILEINVESYGTSASAAASEAAERLTRVKEGLSEFGFDTDSLPSSGYSVEPNFNWEDQTVTGYTARSGVKLVVADLSVLGSILEAAIRSGANDIPSVEFETSKRREAREQALRSALLEARRDAVVLATTGGGELGSLLEVSTTARPGQSFEEIVVSGEKRGPGGLQLTPPEVVIRVSVSTRWRLVEGSPTKPGEDN